MKNLQIHPGMRIRIPQYRVSKREVSEDFTLSVMNEARKLIGKMDEITEYHVAAAYSSIYTKVSKERKSFIRDMDRHRDFYLVDVIVNTIVSDTLTPEIATGKIIEITSSNAELKAELETLKKRINFDQLLLDILPELCFYGDYFLKTVIDNPNNDDDNRNVVKDQLDDPRDPDANAEDKLVPNTSKKEQQGLLEVKDVVEQTEIISLTQDGKRRSYLVKDADKVVLAHASEYVHFTLGGSRQRIKLFENVERHLGVKDEVKVQLQQVPRFLRIGKSIFYGTLSKIRELELLEKLIPATKLSKLSQGTIVGVSLPDSYDLEKGLAAIKRVEGLLNKKIGVDPQLGELTVESIIATSGKYKAIPVFGDRGRIDRIDYKETESDDLLSNVKDIREITLDSIGVPFELVFKSEGDTRANLLKRYSRYLKRLKSMQRALQDGVRQIIKIHFANRTGISFKEEDIKVEFLNKLTEIDNLDNLEHMDITISMMKNLKEYLTDLIGDDMSALKVDIDMKVFQDYLNRNLATIGLTGLVKSVQLKPPTAPITTDTGTEDDTTDDETITPET